jgi:hypothetical protein
MATPTYDVNYEDERFTQVESDKSEAMNDLENTYNDMISNTDKYYEDQINASKDWADTQSQLQQEQTDFTIEQIEQQKDKAHKDYVKEQSGAYVDWQKQSNQYGSEAEKMASSGLTRTGFSESSQVSMFNTYQNRLSSAREVFSNAILSYDNNIKEARIQNNAALAEIAYQSLQQQLELSLQGFQYKNNLILEQANKKTELENQYYQRWQDVLNQINHENAMAEEIRQYEQNYQLQVKQLDEQIRQFEKEFTQRQTEFTESIRQFDEEIARLKQNDEREYKLDIERLELEREQIRQAQENWEDEMAFKREQLAEEKRQFNSRYGSNGGGGTKGSSTSSNASISDTKSKGNVVSQSIDKAKTIVSGKDLAKATGVTSKMPLWLPNPYGNKKFDLSKLGGLWSK